MATNYCEIILDKEKSNKRVDNIWECVITLIKATSQEMEIEPAEQEEYLARDLGSYKEFAEHPFELVLFFFPLIVFEGEIYEAKFSNDEIVLEEKQYIQLFVDYISGLYKGKFFIDIVTRERFSEYLKDIYEDLTVFNKRRVKKKQEYEKEIQEAVKDFFAGNKAA